MKPKNVMTPGDLWWRIGIGALLMVVGLLLQQGTVSMVIFAVGVAWIAWAVFRAVRQVKAAERLQAERNARR